MREGNGYNRSFSRRSPNLKHATKSYYLGDNDSARVMIYMNRLNIARSVIT